MNLDKETLYQFNRAFEELNDLKGRSFNFSEQLLEKLNNNKGYIHNISQYISDDNNSNIEISITPTEYERYILLDVIMNMIKDSEIELTLTDKATDKNINYLNKLVNSLNKKLDN